MKLYGGKKNFAGSKTVYIYADNENPSPSWSSRLLSTNRGFGTYKLMVEPFTYQVGLLLLLSMFTVNKRLPEFTVNVEFSSECKFYMLDRR